MQKTLTFRPTTLIPTIFSAAASALALVLIIAGTCPNKGGDFYLVSVRHNEARCEDLGAQGETYILILRVL